MDLLEQGCSTVRIGDSAGRGRRGVVPGVVADVANILPIEKKSIKTVDVLPSFFDGCYQTFF
jgi:hypothetical protein